MLFARWKYSNTYKAYFMWKNGFFFFLLDYMKLFCFHLLVTCSQNLKRKMVELQIKAIRIFIKWNDAESVHNGDHPMHREWHRNAKTTETPANQCNLCTNLLFYFLCIRTCMPSKTGTEKKIRCQFITALVPILIFSSFV